MTLLPTDLQAQIDKINEYCLVTYLKMLGYTPAYVSNEVTIFHIPVDNSQDAVLIVNHYTNRFHLSMWVPRGSILDLASLLFRAKPKDILADIVPYRLDQLMSTEASKSGKEK